MATIAIPRISPYTVAKYQRIIRFAVGSHSIHIQARWDPNKQWLPLPYNITTDDLDAIVQEWLGDWRVSMSQEGLDKEIPLESPETLYHRN